MVGPAVTIVASGGLPVTQVTSGALPVTAVASGGVAVTLCDNGTPVVIEGGAPENLITNGTFDSGADWTLSQIGGTELPTISGGKLNSTAGNEGNIQRATQTLSGGSSPTGTYRATLDTTVGSGVDVVLLGAADQNRGSGNIAAGTAGTADIVASGEVSKVRLGFENNGTVDNVILQLVS